MGLWQTLQTELDEAEKRYAARERRLIYRTVLDFYALYVAPHLGVERLRERMIKAASKGRHRIAIYTRDAAIPLNVGQMQKLAAIVEGVVQHALQDRRFTVFMEIDRGECVRPTLYINFSGDSRPLTPPPQRHLRIHPHAVIQSPQETDRAMNFPA